MSKIDITKIYQFGDQVALNRQLKVSTLLQELSQFDGVWAPYNPRKHHINRDGLCILNESGKLGAGPALDSLSEYNYENNTNLQESDFNIPTDVYKKSKILPNGLKGIFGCCVRSHFLRLPPGGFFPPHRDHTGGEQKTFRIIFPIDNCAGPGSRFLIEDRILNWDLGRMYVVNTTKQHTLFNAHESKTSIWLVLNIILCEDSINFVSSNLLEK